MLIAESVVLSDAGVLFWLVANIELCWHMYIKKLGWVNLFKWLTIFQCGIFLLIYIPAYTYLIIKTYY